MKNVLTNLDENKMRHVDELIDFLRIPSVSAKREHKADCERAAEWVANQFRAMEFETRVSPTEGHPIVVAKSKSDPSKPTVLVYGHYDVQPPEPLELWESPPFEPRIEDGKLFARGATDDKGQMFAHIKAVQGLLDVNGSLPVNLIFLIEGEEEIASHTLANWIHEYKDVIQCDVAVISDTSQFGEGQPAICLGLRGICAQEFRIEVCERDLHSGLFGGAVANPAVVISQIIAKLKDETGKILIPGFYDDVLPLDDWEREAFAALPFEEEQYKKEHGLHGLHGEDGYTTYERRWARPTLDVNGLFSGYSGEGSKTIIPSWAGAKVTMRLVPDQNANDIKQRFQDYIKSITPEYAQLTFVGGGGNGPVLIPRDAPFMDQAVEAYRLGFGKEPVFIREGGSIPVVLNLSEELGVNVILMGFGRPDDNLHAPNEKFTLDDFHRGIRTAAWFYHLCGESS